MKGAQAYQEATMPWCVRRLKRDGAARGEAGRVMTEFNAARREAYREWGERARWAKEAVWRT